MTTRRSRVKILVFAITAVCLVVLAWYVNNYVSLDEVVIHEENVRSLIALEPLRSFLIGFGIYFALSLIPGTGGKAIVYGWLFGFWQALIIVSVGLTLTGIVIFSLSRYLFQKTIERRFERMVTLMNKHIEKEGAFYLLTLRLVPVPFSIVNPVSGASRVRLWTFFWTTLVGLLPANAIWVYVGIRLPSLRDLANSGPGAFIDPPLIWALVACAMLPFLIRWLVSRFGIPAVTDLIDEANLHESERDKL
jgi:uncharacterized membrane protein YdjX (TVP38/TMEM64 family)